MMIAIKNEIIMALYFVAISSNFAYAQDKKLIDYPRKEAIALLEAGGTDLIKKHGEEILEAMYLQVIPTDEELWERSSAPERNRRNEKRNLPAFKALKSGGEASLNLIQNTRFFKYPRYLSYLEVIAFFLLDAKGQKEALQFAEGQMVNKIGYEKENWQTIINLLKKAELAEGYFFYESITNAVISSGIVQMQGILMKEQLKKIPEAEQSSFFENHYRFQKVLKASLEYNAIEKAWPDSLYLLAEKKLITISDISFIDKEGFAHIPMLLGQLKDGKETQKVLWLEIPDAKYIFEGSLNGDIKIIPSQSK